VAAITVFLGLGRPLQQFAEKLQLQGDVILGNRPGHGHTQSGIAFAHGWVGAPKSRRSSVVQVDSIAAGD
jgi:hypothetical protein